MMSTNGGFRRNLTGTTGRELDRAREPHLVDQAFLTCSMASVTLWHKVDF